MLSHKHSEYLGLTSAFLGFLAKLTDEILTDLTIQIRSLSYKHRIRSSSFMILSVNYVAQRMQPFRLRGLKSSMLGYVFMLISAAFIL